MTATETADAVATFLEATRSNDVDRMVSVLAANAELVSPLSGRMVFRGRDDLRVLLAAVYGGLNDLTWQEVIGQGVNPGGGEHRARRRVTVTDAMVIDLDDAGRITRIRPHLRPCTSCHGRSRYRMRVAGSSPSTNGER